MVLLEKNFGKMWGCDPTCGPCIHEDYEPDTKAFIRTNVKPGMVVFDIGAHVGLFSIVAEQAGAMVHAFEAHPENYLALEANSLLYPGIIPHHVAVWNKKEMLHLDKIKPLAQAYIHAQVDKTAFYEIQGMALDDMDIPIPEFIKSDIQGVELLGLKGMEKRILPGVKFLQVEVYPGGFARYGYTCQDLLEYLKAKGFKCISHPESAFKIFGLEVYLNARFVRAD